MRGVRSEALGRNEKRGKHANSVREWLTLTQGFGENPQNYAHNGLSGHEGLDLVPQGGDQKGEYAVKAGTVVSDFDNPVDGKEYGNNIVIFVPSNKRLWSYAHLAENLSRVAKRSRWRTDPDWRHGQHNKYDGLRTWTSACALPTRAAPHSTPRMDTKALFDPCRLWWRN